MNRLTLFIPLLVCLALGAFLYSSLDSDPQELPSALIGKPFSEFSLPDLNDAERQRNPSDFRGDDGKGRVVLVNVWATWCYACRIEHHFLNILAEQGVAIVGLNYKDDRAMAQDWLTNRGNPYLFSIFDAEGTLGIDLGVYGAPETYLLDAEGVIRHRRVGVVDQRVWDEEFHALYQQLTDDADAR